jgi:hypothetical protein
VSTGLSFIIDFPYHRFLWPDLGMRSGWRQQPRHTVFSRQLAITLLGAEPSGVPPSVSAFNSVKKSESRTTLMITIFFVCHLLKLILVILAGVS